MSGPRALLLDAMGTLVALRPPAPELRRLLRERCGVEVGEHEATAALAREIAFYRAHLQEGRDAASVQSLRGRCAAVLRDALPSAAGRIEQAEMARLLVDSLHFDPFPDAAPAMRRARADGTCVVVVSNWDASLHEALAGAGLAELADHVVTSAECGMRKPEPGIFRRALALAGAEAREALHVGDSLHEDVAGARAAGVPHALLVRDGTTTPAGVVAIAGLDEVPDAWALTCRDA